MQIHAVQEQIHSLRQLSLADLPLTKAITLAIVIDCTSAYWDDNKNCYSRKLNVIDPEYNVQFFTPYDQSTYLTVYLHQDKKSKLPSPRAVGDIIYLKRFKFTRYNGLFQAFSYNAPFCSWTLFDGSFDCEALGAYSTSKDHFNFREDELDLLRDKIRLFRAFAKQFFERNSVLALHPNNFKTKDTDIIVKVLKLSQQGCTLTNGREQLLLSGVDSLVHEGDICKLRSIVRFQKSFNKVIVIKNKFTSLLTVRNSSYDARWFYHNHQQIKSRQDINIYTSLKDILALPQGECKDKQFNIKVQVLQVSPHTFKQALCYYHRDTHTVLDEKPSQQMLNLLGYFRPIYKIKFLCSDSQDLEDMVEIFLYSYDSKCSDLLTRVNLEEDINQFSNFQHEDYFYRQKMEEILTAEYVTMVVEVLIHQITKERALRVVKINEIY